MLHTHQWRLWSDVLLALPDPEGYAERVFVWCCPCGAHDRWSCELRLGAPLPRPDVATKAAATERRQGTPHAQEARRQEQRRRR